MNHDYPQTSNYEYPKIRNYDYPQTFFSKAILAGVFAGIGATLLNLAYDFFFRYYAKLYPSEFINVSSIIFASMLLCTIGGIIYYFLAKKSSKFGSIVYLIIFAALTVLCCILSLGVNRTSNPHEIEAFRGLLLGSVIISGLAMLSIPYLTKHDTWFND